MQFLKKSSASFPFYPYTLATRTTQATQVLRIRKLAGAGRTLLRSIGVVRGIRMLTSPRGRMLHVENTNHCNFNCRYCPTHSLESNLQVTRGHMSLEQFQTILNDHPGAQMVILQGQGEPLLDPTLWEKIELCRSRGLLTQIISNGSLLKVKKIRDKLISSGPDILLFSVDSASPAEVMHNRRGMKYDEVLAGIRAFNDERKAFHGSKRSIILGFLSIVYGEFNPEIEKALLSFNQVGIDVLFYKQLNPSFQNRIQGYTAPKINGIPKGVQKQLNYLVSHQRMKKKIYPCPQIAYELPYYLNDGSKTACCILNDKSYAVPEFSHSALLSRYKKRDLPSECEKCSFFAGYRKN